MIYLDNAATTEMGESVFNAMIPFLLCSYGNPSSQHCMGIEARKAVEKARRQVANCINASPDQIIFTSGGSEGNSMVFASIKGFETKERKDVVISNAEHESVIQSARDFCQDGSRNKLVFLNVDHGCKVEFTDLEKVLFGGKTVLVSALYVNNETGSVNDVGEIARICHENGALYHVDCVQALGNIEIDVQAIGCDFATFSSHKIHGPKGVGALYVKDKSVLKSLIKGTQEYGLRGGTENVSSIVGFGKACEDINCGSLRDLRDSFEQALFGTLKERGVDGIARINVDGCDKILSITFNGIDSETLLALLSDRVCVSAGSACHASLQTPSRVLIAMGLTEEEAYNTIRVSFSKKNTLHEVKEAGKIIGEAVATLAGV